MDRWGSEWVGGWMDMSGYAEGQASIWAGELGVVSSLLLYVPFDS